MNILIANTWYYPNLMGGAEQSVLLLAEGLVRAGHKVSILTCDAKSESYVENINGVEVYRCYSSKYDLYGSYDSKYGFAGRLKNKYYEIFNKKIQQDITKVLKDVHPDVVHVNCFSGLSFCIFKTVKSLNIPVVYTIRNFFVLFPFLEASIKHNNFKKIIKGIYSLSIKKSISYIDYITAPSMFTINKVVKEGLFVNCSKRSIPNCVDTDLEKTLDILERKKVVKHNSVKYLYAGWIIEDKGINCLLDAFKNLKIENCDLYFCGDGKLVEIVKKAEQDDSRIHYVGKLNKEDLIEFYKNSDVLIVPSLCEETFGRVVIEGASFGLPVIVSDRGALPDVVGVLNNGLVFKADNVDELTNCLFNLSNEDVRYEYRRNIPENIGVFSLEHQIDEYLKVYNELINGKR